MSQIRNILVLICNILVRIQILRSLPLTNGSGSGSPNNIRILRILILMRSRIRYTGTFTEFFTVSWHRKDPEPDPHLWLTHADPGGQKTYGSHGCVSRNTAEGMSWLTRKNTTRLVQAKTKTLRQTCRFVSYTRGCSVDSIARALSHSFHCVYMVWRRCRAIFPCFTTNPVGINDDFMKPRDKEAEKTVCPKAVTGQHSSVPARHLERGGTNRAGP